MALKKKSLSKVAEENTQVTKGTKSNQEVLKSGNPSEHSIKHLSNKVVGASVGITKNMSNYESLRVDVWLTDEVQDGETTQQAYQRILGIIDKTLTDTVQSYM